MMFPLFPGFINGTLLRGIKSVTKFSETLIIYSSCCVIIMTVILFSFTLYFNTFCATSVVFYNVNRHKC